jgi:hypothetical protein
VGAWGVQVLPIHPTGAYGKRMMQRKIAVLRGMLIFSSSQMGME